MSVSLSRRPDLHEVCILPTGWRRGVFVPVEVVAWLQDEEIGWTIRDDDKVVTFVIADEIERMLFIIRFAHLIAK